MRILVVAAQFPFPPHSGVNTRVYQLLRQLVARHDVVLLSNALPHDRAGACLLSEMLPVETVERPGQSRWTKRAAQLCSLASPKPYTSRAACGKELSSAVHRLCAERAIEIVQLEASVLCGFHFPSDVKVVLDAHNIEYEVIRRMREGERSLPRRLFNRLEYERYRRFEQRSWARVDGCGVTSDREQPVVRASAPSTATAVVPNGVDVDYFAPTDGLVERRTLVFNGTLEYRPNVDAAYHLAEDIWPRVLAQCPDARLSIVGRARPTEIRRLRRPGVLVTGEVADVRPYLERAAVVGVPVRMGGGTRLKVLEGLAMGKAMVSTTVGCEGLAVRDGEHLLIADGAAAFARRVVELFDHSARGRALGNAGRRLVTQDYSWDLAGERLQDLYERVAASPVRGSRSALSPLRIQA